MFPEYRRTLERQEAEGRALDAYADAMGARIEAARAAAVGRRGSTVPEHYRLTAHHEAGHVVAALVLGNEVTGALIDPDGHSGVAWSPAGQSSHASAMAGLVAEQFAGNAAATASAADLRHAGTGHERVLGQFDAETILAKNYGRVEALAEALLDFGYVDARIIKAFTGLPRS